MTCACEENKMKHGYVCGAECDRMVEQDKREAEHWQKHCYKHGSRLDNCGVCARCEQEIENGR